MKTNVETGSGKNSFLTFRLGQEQFAVHVNNVLNFLEPSGFAKVPKSPDENRGVINLRGTVLPIIDMKFKMGMPPVEITADTCIIVMVIPMKSEKIYVGGLVDKVESVHEIDSRDIRSAPEHTKGMGNGFLRDIAKVNEEFVLIIDAEKIISEKEVLNHPELGKYAVNKRQLS